MVASHTGHSSELGGDGGPHQASQVFLPQLLFTLLASVRFPCQIDWSYMVWRDVGEEHAVVLTPQIPNSIFAKFSGTFP